jgi:hypothetical protein
MMEPDRSAPPPAPPPEPPLPPHAAAISATDNPRSANRMDPLRSDFI